MRFESEFVKKQSHTSRKRRKKMIESVNGILCVDGVKVTDIAKEYGTPCYIMSENTVRENCRKYKSAIEKYYNGKGLPL